MRAVILGSIALIAWAGQAAAQNSWPLPPPSGSQNPVLPPPTGLQNPTLPPPSGTRYPVGQGGRWTERGFGSGYRGAGAGRMGSGTLGGAVGPEQGSAPAAPIGSVQDIGRAIRTCWKPPYAPGAEATVRFGFRRDGTLLGPPRIVHSGRRVGNLLDNGVRHDAFEASVLDAVTRCAPLSFTPGLGAGIAGRIFSLRFHR